MFLSRTAFYIMRRSPCERRLNSLLYAGALSRCKIPFELHVFPFGYHGSSTVDAISCDVVPESMAYVKDWLNDAKRWLKLMGIKY